MKKSIAILLTWLVLGVTSSFADSQPEVLTLDRVLSRVEANHPKLRGAQLANRIASAKVLEASSARFRPWAVCFLRRHHPRGGHGGPTRAAPGC